MELGKKRITPRNVVAGSVWESRMKMDEVKGGIKVFKGEENSKEESSNGDGLPINRSLESNQSGGVREKRKTWKPEPIEVIGIESNPIQVRKTRLDPNKFSSKSCKELSILVDGIEKNPIQIKKNRSVSHKDLINESCEFFGVCKEKIISSSLNNMGQLRNPNPKVETNDYEDDEEDKEEDEEMIEKKSFDVKEVDILEQKLKKVVKEDKKLNQIYRKPIPISPNVKKQPSPIKDHPAVDQDLRKPPPIPLAEEFENSPQTRNKLQSFVDLVMWRDVSKSAFVFGLGAFILISSSYTEDLNFSLISAFSYMGLLYLAGIFLYKTIFCRGVADLEDSSQIHLVGEEEAIWLVKLILPYLNDFILKLRALFSGDPATTIKLTILLFVLAKFGSFITIGKMVKLGFFGAFTLPKVCSSYLNQRTDYGKFSIQRFCDTWHSFSHKKVVAAVVFTLIWNFSSILTRIWGVFMLAWAVRYYQQSMPMEDHGHVEEGEDTHTKQGGMKQRHRSWANRGNQVKERKES